MNNQLEKIFEGIITEHENNISLFELCRFCNLTSDFIAELVSEGILEPVGESKHEWQFTFTTIERVKKVKRLQNDFELNLPGAGLAIHLLDRIEELERLLDR